MPFIAGAYFLIPGEPIYELEVNFFLRFYTKSALSAIKRIKTLDTLDYYENNYPLYYHTHLITLLNMIGLINDRMIAKRGTSESLKTRKSRTRNDYLFTPKKYKVLSNKDARNFIIHLEERNFDLLNNQKRFTAFNSISNESNPKMSEVLRNDKYNSYLDINDFKYHYYDNRKKKRIIIDINEMEEELKMLYKRVEYI